MEDQKHEIENQIKSLENAMQENEFWSDKNKSEEGVKRLKYLKKKLEMGDNLDAGDAVMTILSGAGGDDSEDFAYLLYNMYSKYLSKNNFQIKTLHEHINDHGGIKNITFEIMGDGAYGKFKNESGVHRLVRISPFNAASKRHTSFAMVEVIPHLNDNVELDINPEDLEIILQKGGGPGGQNVNKRETSVRVVHLPTGISVHVSAERTQEANREMALKLIRSKLYKLELDNKQKEKEGYMISKTTEVEWGNQIRNYVMHPYKLVKDLRTGVSTTEIDDVLSGDIDAFINGQKEV